MTDIFFSYSSADRERVRPIRDALVAQGFEVFWDQQVPAGMDWDTWIRQHLTKSKCAMAFWSATSVSSDNVRHEAMVAKQQGKLISVLLEPLTAEQFPMGLYAQQAANLSGWSGDYSHDEWRKFRREFEAKLTPLWVRRQLDELEAELVGERARREGAERRDKVLQAQIAKEAEAQQDLKQQCDKALNEVAALKATVGGLTQARADAETKQAEAQQALKREDDGVLDEVAALKKNVEELTQARADAEARAVELSQHLKKVRQSKVQEIARSIGATLSPLIIAAAVATAGFWTYQLIWSGPETVSADTAAIKEEEQRQAKVADLETKLTSAEAEQRRLEEEVQLQTKAAADADGKRKTAEAEQGRLKEQVQLQTKATADANAKLQAAQTEQQRLKEGLERQTKAATDAEAKAKNAEAEQQRQAKMAAEADSKRKAAEAEQQGLKDEVQRLTKTAADVAAKLKASEAEVQRPPKQEFSGFLAGPADPPASSTGLFTIRTNTTAAGYPSHEQSFARSIGDCEQKCAQTATCKIFSYGKGSGICYTYSRANLVPNESFNSAVRK